MFPRRILLASDGSAEAGQAARMATVVHAGFVPAMYYPEMSG